MIVSDIIHALSAANGDLDVPRFVADNCPQLLVNRNFSTFVYSTVDNVSKIDAVLSAFRAVEFYEQHRPHNRNHNLNLYELYCSFSDPRYRLTQEEFEMIFSDFLFIPLNTSDLTCAPKVLKAVKSLLDLGESSEEITHYLQFLVSNPIGSFTPKRKTNNFAAEMNRAIAYQEARKPLMPLNSNILEALCALEAIEDVTLENSAVLSLFASKIENNIAIAAPLYVIDPSIHFIRRLRKDNPFNRRTLCFFLREEVHVRILNDLLKNTLFHFYNLADLDTVLSSGTAFPTDTLFFGSHFKDADEKSEIIKTLFSYVRSTHSLFVLDIDFALESEQSPKKTELQKTCFKNAWLFPSGIINSTRPEKKILLHVDYGYLEEKDSAEFHITQYSLITSKEEQMLSPHIFRACISKEDYLASRKSLRSIFRAQFMESQTKSASTRQAAEPYEYTPEITVYYTLSGFGTSEQPYRLSAFVREPIIGTGKPKIITGCKKSTKKIRPEDVECWIDSDYIADEGIKKLIADCYLPYYRNKEITLKSFLIFNSDWANSLTNAEKADILFFSSSFLGELLLSQISLEDALSIIDSVGERVSSRINLLSDIFELAVQQGNCSSNPIKPYLRDLRSEHKGLHDVRANLAAKHFTIQQYRDLFNIWSKAYAKGSLLHLAALTCLLTGLDANIVCALRWKDFHTVNIFNKISFCQFYIQRQTCNDGTEIRPFTNKYLYRDVPCPSRLAGLLMEEKAKAEQIHFGMPQQYIAEQFIFVENGKPFSPAGLSKAMRKTIKGLNIPPDFISIPDNTKGSVETNLSDFSGHIFRTSFDFYARHYGKMDIVELEYILGLSPSTTFSSHYCDYGNEYAQLILFVKMERISNFILSDDNYRAVKTRLDILGIKSYSTSPNNQGCTMLNIDFNNINGNAEISVDTKFGSVITVQELDTT